MYDPFTQNERESVSPHYMINISKPSTGFSKEGIGTSWVAVMTKRLSRILFMHLSLCLQPHVLYVYVQQIVSRKYTQHKDSILASGSRDDSIPLFFMRLTVTDSMEIRSCFLIGSFA